MNSLLIFIIAFALAMDCFALAIANSSVSGEVKPGVPLRAALVFAFNHLVLLLGGYFIGGLFQPLSQGLEAWIAVSILVIIGLKMMAEAIRRRPEAKVVDINSGRVVFLLALAASIDAMLAGLALGLMQARLLPAAILTVLAVWLLTFAGLAGGKQLGLAYAKPTALFGGIFMFIAASHLLFLLLR